ncbi:CU044_2847 family protein [Streptomyces katsurahamanus]|uniref:CU044_2847 family protein n=1 Tax=Streptomyces katsurahamanus TaxID=2577098 RepID=UPI002B2054E3|nr:CU044_2847 family protein [Streptomyces katsurahamanus]
MNGRVQRIELPGGAVVHARLSAPGDGYGEDDEDVGVAESAAARVRQLNELIGGVGAAVLEAVAAAGPDEASVSFGIELTAKSGGALAVLASGEAKASVQVTLVWQLKEQRAGEGAMAAAGPLEDSQGRDAGDAQGRESGDPGGRDAGVPHGPGLAPRQSRRSGPHDPASAS